MIYTVGYGAIKPPPPPTNIIDMKVSRNHLPCEGSICRSQTK